MSFGELSDILTEILESNVYVSSRKGKILGASMVNQSESSIVVEEETGDQVFPEGYNDALLKIVETESNITGDRLLEVFRFEHESYDKYVTIVPINGNGQRLGTLVSARHKNRFMDEDLVLAEYAATVVGMEILRAKSEIIERRST